MRRWGGFRLVPKCASRSRWSSLCLPGSGAEGWDLFFFLSEKWLYPSCAGAGAGVAAKVLPSCRSWTRTQPFGSIRRGIYICLLCFLQKSSFFKKTQGKGFSFLSRICVPHLLLAQASKRRNSMELIKTLNINFYLSAVLPPALYPLKR